MRYIDADEIMRRLTYNGDTPVHETYRDGTPVLLQIRGIKDLIRNAPTVQLPSLTPDPVTGLVPCGCGGKPEYHSAKYGYVASVKMRAECPDCHAATAEYYAFMYADDAFKMLRYRAMDAWNTMRGYKDWSHE